MGRSKRVFEANLVEATLNAVKQYGAAGASRSQVAERTGFDLKTVSQLLKRVTEDGNVTVTGQKRGVRYTFATTLPEVVEATEATTTEVVTNQ